MDIAQTAISALVVASVGLILARLGGQRFDALEAGVVRLRAEMNEGIVSVRTDMVRLEARLDARIDAQDLKLGALDTKIDSKIGALDTKIDSKIDALDARIDALDTKLDAKIDALRADLTQIALVVGARPARGTG